jgi:hypothetical protein
LKETRPLWPPQWGVGLQESNLGKTNPRVTLFICLRFAFHPLSRTRFVITNANPACSCVYICKFQFRPIHPPSRRLSGFRHLWSYQKTPRNHFERGQRLRHLATPLAPDDSVELVPRRANVGAKAKTLPFA